MLKPAGGFPDLAVSHSLLGRGVRVAVVGAGFSGLTAGWCLDGGGLSVTVFEATARLGGRVNSCHSFIPGKVVEAGAELIGENHLRWRLLARTFGLTLVPLTTDYGDLKVRVRLGDDDHDKGDLEKKVKPALVQLGKEAKGIDAVQPWNSPNARSLDRKSVADRLDDMKDILGSASSPARRYLEFVLGNDQCAPVKQQSYLGLLTAISAHRLGTNMLAYWEKTETHRCKGGNQQLAQRLARPLGDNVRRETPVRSLQIDARFVRVGFVDRGVTQSEDFDYVVLAVPPAVWHLIDWSPPLPAAAYTMMHGPAVKYLSRFDRKFWTDRKLAPSALWDQLGSVWESTDKQDKQKGGFGLTAYSGGSYVLGADGYAARMDSLYPGYASNVKEARLVNWPAEPWIGTGNSIPGVGQVYSIGRNLSLPYQGRLYFAGEQASPGFFGYMEGALQSGHRAAFQIALEVVKSRGHRVAPSRRSAP